MAILGQEEVEGGEKGIICRISCKSRISPKLRRTPLLWGFNKVYSLSILGIRSR